MNRKYFQLLTLVLALAPLAALAQSSLEIPSGTSIRVRMIDNLSSEQTQMGDTFRGTLDEPIEVNGTDSSIPRARTSSAASPMCIPPAGSLNPANSTWCLTR